MITPEQKSIIADRLRRGLPFATFQHPGQERATLFTEQGDTEFFACPFAAPFGIRLTLAGHGPTPEMWIRSTSRKQHTARVAELTRRLRQRGQAKTVLSAAFCQPCSTAEALEMACRLFEHGNNEFCSFYSLPGAGLWLGATPEVLLKVDPEGHFSTMALAGTMPLGSEPWSEKNKAEHRVVVDYIADVLRRAGAAFETGPMGEKAYGSVRHLLTHFEGTVGPNSIEALVDALNPTPALCGYPAHEALNDIAELEDHPRLLYGGILGTIGPDGLQAYVNIRCARIGGGSMCVYAGGGIMPDSDPEAEWAEALAKRRSLLAMLRG